jgi:hypothetical protein
MADVWERLLQSSVGDVLERLAEVLAPGEAVTMAASLSRTSISNGKVEVDMGEITVEDTSGPLIASAVFRDIHGHETEPDEVPEWTSSDEAVATVEAAEDGKSATITVVGPGAAVINVNTTETAEDGTETEMNGNCLVTVNTGDVTSIEVNVGPAGGGGSEPVPEPAPEPAPEEPTA